MLKPLEQFYCDYCGEIIGSPSEGYLEWLAERHDGSRKASDFRIVHHAPHSPRRKQDPSADCYHHTKNPARADNSLEHFVGTSGLVSLVTMLDLGPYHDPENEISPRFKDNREYAEILRRLHFPYYEEARTLWERAESSGYFEGANETWIYLPDTLKTLIERYGDDD